MPAPPHETLIQSSELPVLDLRCPANLFSARTLRGQYSMGKERPEEPVEGVSTLLSKLHLTRNARSKNRRHAPVLPSRIDPELVLDLALLTDPSNDQMETDDRQRRGNDVDFPFLQQISTLLHPSSEIVPAIAQFTDPSDMSKLRAAPYSALCNLKQCGLTPPIHWKLLKQWQTTTCQHLTSPVFDSPRYWSHHILELSSSNKTLHRAILALTALHYKHENMKNAEDLETTTRIAYRLRADAERNLRFHHNEADHEVTVATHTCLLVFDYLTGNYEEWTSRIVSTKLAMRVAKFSSSHIIGRYSFWVVSRHDRLAFYTRRVPSVLDVDDLLWDVPPLSDSQQESSSSSTIGGTVDEIGTLYAELEYISKMLSQLTCNSDESHFDRVDARLGRWKEKFPLSLQTFEHVGPLFDDSCFLHAQTCAGGPRAIALHALFSEIMITRLAFMTTADQREAQLKTHEHAVTICKVSQSLSFSPDSIESKIAKGATLSSILCSLFVAGHKLFSSDGKTWSSRMLRSIGDYNGTLIAEKLVDQLERVWHSGPSRSGESHTNVASMDVDGQS